MLVCLYIITQSHPDTILDRYADPDRMRRASIRKDMELFFREGRCLIFANKFRYGSPISIFLPRGNFQHPWAMEGLKARNSCFTGSI